MELDVGSRGDDVVEDVVEEVIDGVDDRNPSVGSVVETEAGDMRDARPHTT